jgi:hypothetical protein
MSDVRTSQDRFLEARARNRKRFRRLRIIASLKFLAVAVPIYLLIGLIFQGFIWGTPHLDFPSTLHILAWPVPVLIAVLLAWVLFYTGSFGVAMIVGLIALIALGGKKKKNAP